MKEASIGQFMLNPESFKTKAFDDTRVFREYMVQEAMQQYRDYYETDTEDKDFFEFMDHMTNRDKIRFMEIFTDYTIFNADQKDYSMIKKREYNPELSLFSNLVLDLADFKDRVRPLAKDIALMDVTRKYQRNNVNEMEKEREEFARVLKNIYSKTDKGKLDEGYSSRELEDSGSDRAPDDTPKR